MKTKFTKPDDITLSDKQSNHSATLFEPASSQKKQFVDNFQLQSNLNNLKKGLQLVIKHDLKKEERSLDFYEELAQGTKSLDDLPHKLKEYFFNQQEKIKTSPLEPVISFEQLLLQVIVEIKNEQFELLQNRIK